MPSGQISPMCVVRSQKFLCHSFCLTESYHLTPRSALEVVRNPKIPRNALRAKIFIVCGPLSESILPFVLRHRELSFDTSLASGGGQELKIPTNALRLKISDECGPISKIFVPFVLAHRELSFDTSLAFGGGQDRQIQPFLDKCPQGP
ncbi:hypothetical protein DdX_03636 [Ditylenchus destructor]|uniref:Uncharacterized protein n=1 Tax=Ditylenchus destructor TaxID=166010 RepID=A0AAD4RB70_9BILA|nr:hypothetical protein DdX_03636 [Ditylenchus destructor]